METWNHVDSFEAEIRTPNESHGYSGDDSNLPLPVHHMPSEYTEIQLSPQKAKDFLPLHDSGTHLPHFKINLPLGASSSKILEIFVKAAAKKRFQVIEQNGTMATAVFKAGFNLRSLILCCLSQEAREQATVSAVRLAISVNEQKCMRTVLCKGLYGYPQIIMLLLSEIKVKLEQLSKNDGSEKPIRKDKLNSYRRLSSDQMIEIEEEVIVTCQQESSSYYHFHKILSSEAYTLGKSVSEFIDSFFSQYRNIEESADLIPQPLDSIKLMIEETVEALFSHFNSGRANTEKMMHFCRPAVEKYIFGKLYSHLFQIYIAKYSVITSEFQSNRSALRSQSRAELMASLCIQPKFQLESLETPYKESLSILNKLEEFGTPVEKLNCLLTTVATMKTEVVDYWKGKEELQAMDDELPIVIYLVVSSEISNLPAQIYMLQDYVGTESRFENELRLVTNFEAALKYVSQNAV
jgi:hypothetical protein